MPLLVTSTVNFPRLFNIGLRRNAISPALRSDAVTDFSGTKGFITKHRASVQRDFPEQGYGFLAVMNTALRETQLPKPSTTA